MANAKEVAKGAKESGSSRVQNARPVIGRVIDYLFGRNTLIGLASLMLLVISGYATWSGMNDFIVGVSTSPAAQGREIVGGLSVSNSLLVIAIVVALTFLMWLSLRETFAYGRRMRDRLLTFPLYIFLLLWSIGFGYGFWWSLIAGEEATRKGLTGLQEDARDAGAVVTARLEAVKVQLDSVVQWSDGQMAREEASGGSCGVSSGAGRGPLYNARKSVRDSVSSLRDSVTTSWLNPVQDELEKLKTFVSSLDGGTVEERQKSFEAMARNIRGSARSIAVRSNQLGQSTASEMQALAEAVSIKPEEESFSCYDPTLAQRLRAAADQAQQPAVLRLREASFSEGAAGVANAVKNLWANIGSYISGGFGYLFGMTDGETTADGNEISGRDLIAFLATLGIDLGLFVLTALNPPQTPPDRKLPGALKRQIIDAIKTAIKRAPDANWEWVRQHFIHHKSISYFVIPNIYGAEAGRPGEQERALAMNQLAGVLGDLGLITELSTIELRFHSWEEQRGSYTDLARYREQWVKRQQAKNKKDVKTEKSKAAEGSAQIEHKRNHGVFSKAERALEIAKWSEQARSDVEIFKLVDREGLTPLLAVLNEPGQDLEPYEKSVLNDGEAKKDDQTSYIPISTEKISTKDAHTQYVAGLLEGAELEASHAAIIARIEKGDDIIHEALEQVYVGWPQIRNHVNTQRSKKADIVERASVTVRDAWITDKQRVYPLSKIPTRELKYAVVTYNILALVRDDLKRMLGESDVADDKIRTDAIKNAVQAIDTFLDPQSQMSADDLAAELQKFAAASSQQPTGRQA